MVKLLTVVGARPQIIKAAALSRAIRKSFSNKISEQILHTGQHYDNNMSQVFFDEMGIPEPDFNLEVGSSGHGVQTAAMIVGVEEILITEKPDFIVLYGDTNSTLAGAIAASKLKIPIVHIEAGLRSFNKSMPEEINRIMCDHASTLLFSPTQTGVSNLQKEGFNMSNQPPFTSDNPAVFHCGDIMYDNSLYFSEIANEKSKILEKDNLSPGEFILATIHRDNNTDDPVRMNGIFEALNHIASNGITVFLPLHPRASKLLKQNINKNLYQKISTNPNLIISHPVSFLDIIKLEKNARMIITDSGGVQKESYFFKKPCIILRPQTEWVEIVDSGAAMIVDADKDKILKAYEYFSGKTNLNYPPVFGDGKAAEFICNQIIYFINNYDKLTLN
ncbi:MAG: UDP-N-acetylglucosamine 2-epimerase (non-hydrolyzing) [Bacteroidetes bacterium 4572_114]|nr:MAG: UDP-N-acetylglucosamine 2-epimerase (non-hydrolyzing) [Bacteroidetes bacterium 4572_114]